MCQIFPLLPPLSVDHFATFRIAQLPWLLSLFPVLSMDILLPSLRLSRHAIRVCTDQALYSSTSQDLRDITRGSAVDPAWACHSMAQATVVHTVP